MTSNVRESSKEAFRERIRSGKQATDTSRISRFVLDVPRCTARQIAAELEMETATVSGIVNGLVKAKVLYRTELKSPCPVTGSKVHWLVHMSRIAPQVDMFGGVQ